jgi:7-keto-8-aminopelargonate synthetase-like enzyme
MRLAAALRERGLFIPAIRYPTVPRGTARLRLTLSADHTGRDLDELKRALSSLLPGAIRPAVAPASN